MAAPRSDDPTVIFQRDQAILDEARADREHRERVAKIVADRDVETEVEVTKRVRSRHKLTGSLLGGILFFAVVASVVWGINADARDERASRERIERDRQRVAEVCITEGNIWMDNNCLITRREE